MIKMDKENMRCPKIGCKGGKMANVLPPGVRGKKVPTNSTYYLDCERYYQRCSKCGSIGLVPVEG